ncbi:ATP-binding protein [Candidatus Babeliales bacterium]|nr:ATP-binding protein [Candidatus Babeliales bacterium]
MIIKRTITAHLQELATQFPVVAVMGPRQSGKTTLVKETFAGYAYVTLEDLDKRSAAQQDPRGFFATYAQHSGLIIDEIQEVPELLSYMQGIVDQAYRPGYFIITGSQHFLMYEKITQTLAGRIALLTLLPLSVQELRGANMLPEDFASLFIKGCYPRLYSQPISVQTWCSNYISTYVEKDVRQVLNISDVIAFQGFLKLCAARIGNLLNYADIARDAGISLNTAKSWIAILQASYIIKLLPPYYKNFNKRVIKSPKIYFNDTALVCSLLGIRTAEELHTHPLKGALFESFVISEMFKHNYNHNKTPQIYFWRDVQGHEIDVVIEKSYNHVVPVEIKAGMTFSDNFFRELFAWREITEQETLPLYVVYGGNENLQRKEGRGFCWNSVEALLSEIYGS